MRYVLESLVPERGGYGDWQPVLFAGREILGDSPQALAGWLTRNHAPGNLEYRARPVGTPTLFTHLAGEWTVRPDVRPEHAIFVEGSHPRSRAVELCEELVVALEAEQNPALKDLVQPVRYLAQHLVAIQRHDAMLAKAKAVYAALCSHDWAPAGGKESDGKKCLKCGVLIRPIPWDGMDPNNAAADGG